MALIVFHLRVIAALQSQGDVASEFQLLNLPNVRRPHEELMANMPQLTFFSDYSLLMTFAYKAITEDLNLTTVSV